MTDPIVRLSDITLSLRSAAGLVNILRGVSLEVNRGQHMAVVGPSGSGKSSLLAITAGLERPSSGRVEIAGQDLSALNEDSLAQFRGRYVGIVFQSFHLVPTMTAQENVALPLELAGEAGALERASEALATVGLGARTGHLPTELSGGEQQRVALARALIARPPLLLADEPTGNLDADTSQTIVDLLFDLNRELDTTLILVTHDLDLAGLTQRVIRLRGGEVISDEQSSELHIKNH
jgi:putative ABC transport system ATP-binding protein